MGVFSRSLSAAVARLEGERNGKSETRRVGRQSALGGVTNCKLIASIYISAGAMKAHVRIESRRHGATRRLGFPVFPSQHLPRRVTRRHIHVNRRNCLRDLFLKNCRNN